MPTAMEEGLRQALTRVTIDARPRHRHGVTREVDGWLGGIGAGEGLLTVFVRHTSASLTIQENADPDVLADALVQARLVPTENEQALRLAAMMAPRGPEGVSLPFRVRDGGPYLGPLRPGDLEY